MKIAIFKDNAFLAPPDYNADDIVKLLSENHLKYELVSERKINKLSSDTGILILPYIDGEFSQKSLDALIRFHSNGGSLFFLGDLPHRGKWYPLRNMFAYKFHLTRSYDDVSISADKPGIKGLTEKGHSIIGNLNDINFFNGENFHCLRVTAFPPDITYPLLKVESSSHAEKSTSIVAIERKCKKFYGAKFAMIGFNGGEPRENACGAYKFYWKYDPGLLTRKWKDINNVVLKLIKWLTPSPKKTNITIDKSDIWMDRLRRIKQKPVYGFSTYWAFNETKIPDEFKFFCSEMIKRGCRYIRANIPWEDIEPAPKKYDWRKTDQLAKFAEKENFLIQFWVFPTVYGSGLSDAGIPKWTLKEPAIDRFGRKGNFPTLWSQFYREHYFNMLTHLTKRYAKVKALQKFIFDFGNSDFPYSYHYYGGDNTIFDYSPQERKAFVSYLKNELEWSIEKCNILFSKNFTNYNQIPVPFSEEKNAFSVYLDFRTWTIRKGIEEAHSIIRKYAPEKLPPDLPGHGLGSIADLSTYFYEAKAKHFLEEKIFPPKYTKCHNFGKIWGGEPWQVGGDYRQYDEALFQSVRLGADYFTIPGADLGVYGEDIAKIGYIRHTLTGAKRFKSELAVIDDLRWNNFTSLAHVASRFDFPVDLLSKQCRFDFSCYKLLTLPSNDEILKTVTGGGGGRLVPDDEEWYWLLKLSVEKGLNLLIFPETCKIYKTGVQRTFLRQVFALEKVKYKNRKIRNIIFPDSFGRGKMSGKAFEVIADGNIILKDSQGYPLLIEKKYGKGAVFLAGYDNSGESFDKALNYEEVPYLREHTLLKLCNHLGIQSNRIDSNNLYVWKEIVQKEGKMYFLLFSHCKKIINAKIKIKLTKNLNSIVDMATNEEFKLKKTENLNWYEFDIHLNPRVGRYLKIHEE
ncbi:MAG TPA: beta-galactosidase [Victivallales bacterium]|nr:beta-galactosidase [Victivallales bacterium]HRR29075.1 beta-galactosidase [Victivallales bacterium]